eukprot:TRINITY_DN7467_c0_g1_i1.p2 TRINITY_DN7467_c0_g1~~TRINITY_DN7467_c0_g1_i1.p2  ORF type:complete len:210 (+),score=52.26 TRINITY_DN7467_c0_g1_i1:90-632(+)
MVAPECTPLAGFFGMMGASLALGFANLGAAYGTVKSGVAVAHLGIVSKGRAMRGMVPVVMAGILGIYGLIIAVIVSSNVKTSGTDYPLSKGLVHLGAGLAGGMASLAAGFAIGVVGDSCATAYQRTDKIFVAMILMLIFAEALGLYGMIIALLMNSTATSVGNKFGAASECSMAAWKVTP